MGRRGFVVGDAVEESGGEGGGVAGAAALLEVAGVAEVAGGTAFFLARCLDCLAERGDDDAELGGGGEADLAGHQGFKGGETVLDVWAGGPEGEGGHGEAVEVGDVAHGEVGVGEGLDNGVLLLAGDGGGEGFEVEVVVRFGLGFGLGIEDVCGGGDHGATVLRP